MADGPETTSDSPARAGRRLGRFDWMLAFPVAAAVALALGETTLAMVLVAILPACLVLDRRLLAPAAQGMSPHAATRADAARVADDVLADCARRDRTTAILHVQVDDPHVADADWGDEAATRTMDRVVQRVAATMRGQDVVMRLGEDAVVVVLAPTRRADLDSLMGIVDRLQASIAEPISIDGRPVRVHSHIGLCTEAMAPARNGAAMLAAADRALRIARRQGPDEVRAFNPDMRIRVETDNRLATQVEDALEAGEVRPWFQPQVDASTGKLLGFEALARWHHPELGVLPPERFLDAVVTAGRSVELGERILAASLDALGAWDRAGLDVPCVGVNLCLEQLGDPRLVDRIAWQLDRQDVAPARVRIEILETVALRDGDETIMRNVDALREAGFLLDLDDFGTGAASIAHIARFGVHRIKIDRSFVNGLDRDPSRRQLASAILGLADRLGIEALAEGVETNGERAALVELGCAQVQGFAIAAPMPLEETLGWPGAPALAARSLATMVPHGTA